MNKKIILMVALMLTLVVVFAACKKDEYKEAGGTTVGPELEASSDEYGYFVTNVDGDRIPVTSDSDGFYDNLEDLITATTEKSDSVIPSINADGEAFVTDKDGNEDLVSTKPNGDVFVTNNNGDEHVVTTDKDGNHEDVEDLVTKPTTPPTSTTTSPATSTPSSSDKGDLVIGTSGKQDSIKWEDIKNA